MDRNFVCKKISEQFGHIDYLPRLRNCWRKTLFDFFSWIFKKKFSKLQKIIFGLFLIWQRSSIEIYEEF
jgi:hypothetical protein